MSNFFNKNLIFFVAIFFASNLKPMQEQQMQIEQSASPHIESSRFHLGVILTILTLKKKYLNENLLLTINTREIDGHTGDRLGQPYRLAEYLSGQDWFEEKETFVRNEITGELRAVHIVKEKLHKVGFRPFKKMLEEQFPGLKEEALKFLNDCYQAQLDAIKNNSCLSEQDKICRLDYILRSFLKDVAMNYENTRTHEKFNISSDVSCDDDAYFIPVRRIMHVIKPNNQKQEQQLQTLQSSVRRRRLNPNL
ncbi:MAG: hypothetical protein WC436_00290 [Candidatus Babeliales bacterium]